MQACAQRMSLRQAGGLCGLHFEPRCTARRAWFTVLTRPCPPRAALPPPCSPSSVQQLRVQQQSRVVVPGRRRCVAVSASAAVVSAAARRAAAWCPAAAAPISWLKLQPILWPACPAVCPQSEASFHRSPQATKTLKIGTRGSPLALAQAYLTRDLLKASGAPLLSCSTSVRSCSTSVRAGGAKDGSLHCCASAIARSSLQLEASKGTLVFPTRPLCLLTALPFSAATFRVHSLPSPS